MSGLGVLLLLIFISAVPVIAVYLWFRTSAGSFSIVRFLLSLLAGAAAFLPALVFQNFLPEFDFSGRWGLFGQIFIRVALSEELSRILMLFILFRLSGFYAPASGTAGGSALSYSDVNRGAAAGLVAGLGFAIIENAAYGASDAGLVLLRGFTAAPLHGACGARVGAAAMMFRKHSVQALFRFLSAVVIHGVYNFMIVLPGFPAIAAVLIALSALASSILAIRGGDKCP